MLQNDFHETFFLSFFPVSHQKYPFHTKLYARTQSIRMDIQNFHSEIFMILKYISNAFSILDAYRPMRQNTVSRKIVYVYIMGCRRRLGEGEKYLEQCRQSSSGGVRGRPHQWSSFQNTKLDAHDCAIAKQSSPLLNASKSLCCFVTDFVIMMID